MFRNHLQIVLNDNQETNTMNSAVPKTEGNENFNTEYFKKFRRANLTMIPQMREIGCICKNKFWPRFLGYQQPIVGFHVTS